MSTTSAEGLRALCISLVVITTVVSGLRLHARRVQGMELSIDDRMIIPSLVAFIGMVACVLCGVQLRQFGYPQTQVTASHLPFLNEPYLYLSLDMFSAASLGFTRLSALFLFRRIFCLSGRTAALRAVISTSIMVISLWMVVFTILPLFQCWPHLDIWLAPASFRGADCSISNRIALGFSVSDLLIATAVIVMPIPSILRLQTSFERRLDLVFVFLTAFVSLGAVVARLVIVVKFKAHQIKDDYEANTTSTFMWILEAGFSLIAVNLPSLWWLRQKVQPKKILESVRSLISRRSMRSSNSGINSSGANGGLASNSQWLELVDLALIEVESSSRAGMRGWALRDYDMERSTRFAIPEDAAELVRGISGSTQL